MAEKRKPELDELSSKFEGFCTLSPRQILIQKLNKLLYAAQIKEISDEKANEILRLLTHI